MTAFGIQLGWLAIRVTLVAALGWLLLFCTRRRSARANVLVLTGSVIAFLALTMLAVCPLPDFRHWYRTSSPTEEPVSDLLGDSAPGTASRDTEEQGGLDLGAIWIRLEHLTQRVPASVPWQRLWLLVAVVYGAGSCLAGIKLLAGWFAVRRLRRHSLPLLDSEVVGLLDELKTSSGCCRSVELRECREPGLAATIGWRRPVILLPPEWRCWTKDEIHAVLAHELIHVRHRDYLIGFLTRLCQALYFYHPLVRRLSAQLRWYQELGADAVAADVLGSRDLYRKALARLALRSPARMPAGAMAWSGLTGPTLLRRIQMLQGTEKRRPLGWSARGLIVILLAASALLVSGLGGGALLPAAEEPAGKLEPFELGYLHANSKGLLAIRPALCFKQPGMEKASQMLDAALGMLKQFGVTWPPDFRPEHIERLSPTCTSSRQARGNPAHGHSCSAPPRCLCAWTGISIGSGA